MALYNHVKNKDDLLDGMLDRVAAEIELPGSESPGTPPAGGGVREAAPSAAVPPAAAPSAAAAARASSSAAPADWRHRARRRAVSAHATLMRHPWSAALWTSRIGIGPARMRYLDSALRDLREAGFAPGLLDLAFHTVENHIVGHAMQELGFSLDQDDMEAMGPELLRSFPVAEYPCLAEHIRYHVEEAGDDAFEFGLDLILDGLERLRAGEGASERFAPFSSARPGRA
ncbi:TetR/AcrR family transcriptional regulator C-terminal domain-containing protein [Myceligenerans sp. TRM 65318]|uniref:TetR/AcrR family transcriptional regulator C-terminal domain-containing protein n=2 Tax=Myceligenerans pegani TaxID=2776917 RepID=A0ABR9MVX5_9MICO|nr:TetR/AcrR family transcriptional regulator C-terminal domain-containing protein [Myceligenerans sp. TRM 65318]MBE3017808.1 TetR/AcrR family transcriptional regulator C-terminal domain-containing protein [Myceligenerans sp. TRM 65318]